MPKQLRILQKIFGRTGSSGEFGKIGSEAAGSPVTTKDLDLIQSLSQYEAGLFAITSFAGEPPRIQDINALYFLVTSQLAYLFQNGIPEWNSTTEYYAAISFVTKDGVIYQALTGSEISPNVGNDPDGDVINWRDNDAYTERVRALAAESVLASDVSTLSSTKAPIDSPTFTGTVTVPDGTVSGAAVNKGQLDSKTLFTSYTTSVINSSAGTISNVTVPDMAIDETKVVSARLTNTSGGINTMNMILPASGSYRFAGLAIASDGEMGARGASGSGGSTIIGVDTPSGGQSIISVTIHRIS